MSVCVLSEVRKGTYLDSVALMRLSRRIAAMPAVSEAALMMATPANRQILAAAGLLADHAASAGGNDLIIAVRAESREAAEAALA
ncbi:MAG: oxidoreductase, partial [Hyphomicrobiaceae bacterium]